MIKLKKLRKIYLVTLCVGCISLILSIILISVILKNNHFIELEPTQDIFKLAIDSNQVLLLRFSSMIPLIVSLINITIFVWLYIVKKYRGKSYQYSLIWITFSLGYTVMTYFSSAGFIIQSLVYFPIMIGAWISKILTIKVLWKESNS